MEKIKNNNGRMFKIAALVLCVALVSDVIMWFTFGSDLWQRIKESTGAKEAVYTRDGDEVTFGSYPQSQVEDEELISILNQLSGGKPETGNPTSGNWTSYGYYIFYEVTHFMYYQDVTYQGNKYRGVYFSVYRPYFNCYESEYNNQEEYGFLTDTIYWFQYEPLTWRVVSETDSSMFLVSKRMIDEQTFDDGGHNNYENSTVRKWLNETFYNMAFSEAQKAIIQTTTVDNSAASTMDPSNRYACADTKDKVFLLSYAEITSKAYGLNTERSTMYWQSDYAEVQGTSGNWWLRSPHNFDQQDDYTLIVFSGSSVGEGCIEIICFTSGIVPAINISK